LNDGNFFAGESSLLPFDDSGELLLKLLSFLGKLRSYLKRSVGERFDNLDEERFGRTKVISLFEQRTLYPSRIIPAD